MKVVDLFCGIGGLSLGFVQSGYEIVAAIDNWKDAESVYRANFPNHNFQISDLSNVSKSIGIINGYSPDLIVGGPPCQDFTPTGSRNPNGKLASLTISFAKIVSEIKPSYFLMENVPAIRNSGKIKEIDSIFRKSGYAISCFIADASLCGVPQKRKRLLMFGELGGIDGNFERQFNSLVSDKPMTVRDAFGSSLDFEYYWTKPQFKARGVYCVDEPSPTIMSGSWRFPKGYKYHEKDCIPPMDSMVKDLSISDLLQIQGFPKDYKMSGPKSSQYKMIGNAVPVGMAKLAADSICKIKNNPKNKES